MNPVLRNILAVVLGWLIGSIVNMALVFAGHFIFPIEGVDPNDMEAMAEVMPTLSSEYFLFPFLAHAIGTLVGAFIAAKIAATYKMTFALVIGAIFLLGGILVSTMIPAPTWFTATDLILAYIPMAWLGGKLCAKGAKKAA
ncbi:hypothetical protein [Psychroserpens sp.]|uniref:hypothetical protein n=1 Tax=Psychroserpens sp. TaxID=2020870 RepID=UPI001B2D0487|nr:hypothetical protein [Psychroserpens sp.]MBO6607220.1 hypothetical protein [Psychroserpens sp.]MBO6631501.1 hypothetical protein [Psychroserpens sp.]MBO6654366.1 hypothetical protein [Psychroserpens sp.]MBO6682348.1 hypothetical protein [Psychroserpens sp.]MBO6750992.1 hypothetical protein [Psychroserpens sp.]